MANKFVGPLIFVVVLLALGMYLQHNYNLFAISGSTALSRNVPASVSPGQTFTVTYATSGAPSSGKYFVAFSDTITGGCTPATYNNFMAQESGGDSTATKTFTAPQSGSCTFKGYYQFSGGNQVNFADYTIAVKSCKTVADTNCDSALTTSELLSYANLWVSGTVTFSELINIANTWVGG
jgi:hypothetical protein